MSSVSRYEQKFLDRICQGNIYRNITYFEKVVEKEADFIEFRRDFSVVISQDCDLHQDYCLRESPPDSGIQNQDKYVINILFCPLYLFESFIKGEHLVDLGRRMQMFNSDARRKIKTNQNFRYHFFQAKINYQLPELVADFKHFFSIDRDFFYNSFHNENYYLCSLNSLFREDLSQRFSNYLARIALPELSGD